MIGRTRTLTLALAALAAVICRAAADTDPAPPPAGTETPQVRLTIDLDAGARRSFIPAETFGAGIDGHEEGATRDLLRGSNLARMQAVGFGPYSYRLRTELGVQAWHWNPAGRFSGHDGRSGYWLSEATPGRPIEVSYGYRLPRRGSSVDQANDDGYSRLDDGDPASFWKSNPYLDRHFTGEDNAGHPQWVLLDLGRETPIDAVRVEWGRPHARVWRAEYCTNPDAHQIENRICDTWAVFPQGRVEAGAGGSETVRLAAAPIPVRLVRLLLSEPAPVPAAPGDDVRDTLGYAIRELGLGVLDEGGLFRDRVRHAPSAKRQTAMIVSSTDPWHRAADRDPNTEQMGLDAFYRSGFAGTLPPLIPVPVLYDTPENAAALIVYLKRRGYPLAQVEMGEEPDGQYATPEDYGALYLQVAAAVHRIDPQLQLGGPGFQTAIDGYPAWPIGTEHRHWMTRFLHYLAARGRAQDFRFFSFEWYPFDDCCGDTTLQLAVHPRIFRSVLDGLRADGLPPDLPWMITEYGYSAFGCRAEVDLEGALLNAETVGLALEEGAARVFLYGLEPVDLMDELRCNSWGNNALFLADARGGIRAVTATFHAARLIDSDWIGPPGAPHRLFPVTVSGAEVFGLPRVTAFALRLPDDTWSLLVLNKDPENRYDLRLAFRTGGAEVEARGPLRLTRFSRAEYQWGPAGERGRPLLDRGPYTDTAPALPVGLPPYSLSILRQGSQPGAAPVPPARPAAN